jgi:hypothetical protein
MSLRNGFIYRIARCQIPEDRSLQLCLVLCEMASNCRDKLLHCHIRIGVPSSVNQLGLLFNGMLT